MESLEADVAFEGVFRASNGEVGVRPADALAWLDMCRARGVEVLGWDLWVVDHAMNMGDLAPLHGVWCGLIPKRGGGPPAVMGGEGDWMDTRAQIAATDFEALVEPALAPYLRVNLTLDD